MVALFREEDALDTAAGGEDFLDFLADALLGGFRLDGGAAVGEPFVEVFLEAEPVAVALDREVVGCLRQRLQGGLDVADVEARLGDGEADFGLGGFALGLAAVGLEEDGGGDFAVEAGVFDGVLGLGVEPGGVGAFPAADVGRDRAFELGLAQLLKDGRAEHGIFEGGGTQADEGVFMTAFEALLVRLGHPEGQHAQHATGLLETGQLLPFAFEHGNGSGVEGIGGGELVAGAVQREPVGQLLAMLNDPVAVFVAGFQRVLGKHDLALAGDGALVPLEQPAADDFGSFGLGGHDDGLAEPVEHLS